MAYTNTLITVAEDCPIESRELPISDRNKIPLHLVAYNLLTQQPYTLNHKELTFELFKHKEGLTSKLDEDEKQELWSELFKKGHPCLRASSLTKRYGYGAHYDEYGKIALYPIESQKYEELMKNQDIKKIAAMRSKRKKS